MGNGTIVSWLGTLAMNGPLILGAYWLAGSGFRQPAGPGRGLATAVLAWTWATLGLMVLGTAGWLTLGPLTAWSLLGLGLGLAVRRQRGRGPVGREDASEDWSWIEALALGLVLAPCVVLGTRALLGPVKVVSDGPIYHLYFAIRWWKAGDLRLVPVPFGESAAPYFPGVGDLWFTWLTIGWGGDRLAKIGQVPFFVLAALAAWELCRRLGAGRAATAVALGWFLTVMPLVLYAVEPNVDTIFLAGYLLAAYEFVRYGTDPSAGTETLALGALAAGGAWGTKPTGIVFVPPLLVVAAGIVLWRQRDGRTRRRHLTCLLLLPAVMVGFWYGRNAWWTGNPLYPLDVSALGWVGWYDPSVMSHSRYYIPRAEWRALVDILLAVLDPRMTPFWLAAVLGAWAIGRPRDRATDGSGCSACWRSATSPCTGWWCRIARSSDSSCRRSGWRACLWPGCWIETGFSAGWGWFFWLCMSSRRKGGLSPMVVFRRPGTSTRWFPTPCPRSSCWGRP